MRNNRLNIKLVQISSELGAGTRGASKGMSGLVNASINKGSRVFDELDLIVVPNANDALEDPLKFKYAKRITQLLPIFEDVSNSVRNILSSETNFPIVLAGDHSTAVGTIAGMKAAYPDKNIGVIWIDAHADIHTPYTTPSGNMHGMPIAVSLNLDHQLSNGNEPHEEVIELWDKVKNLTNISPKLKSKDIVYIGVRDVEWQEEALMNQFEIRNFKVEEVREKGVDYIVNTTLKLLKDTDVIYISYDVDVLDPSLSRGTGTPVDNGFMLEEIKGIISKLVVEPKVKCFEMVEINPTLDDKGNKMAEMALEILELVVALKER